MMMFELLVLFMFSRISQASVIKDTTLALTSEDEEIITQLAADHLLGNIFYYEENKHVSDTDAVLRFYQQQIDTGTSEAYVYYELSLIEGGFGELNARTPSMNVSWNYLVIAAQLGHPAALHKLATAYFTGLYGAYSVPIDIGRSLILDQMAALKGYVPAHMSLGYKHSKGIGVKLSCEKALLHYEYAANVVIDNLLRRGYAVQNERLHISQAERKRREMRPEVLEYYHQAAVEGEVQSAINLGNIYLQGSRIARPAPDTLTHCRI